MPQPQRKVISDLKKLGVIMSAMNSPVAIADFHFHDLRHCVASFLVELKVPESTIMRIQGWSERDRIDIYRHNPEHDAKEQKKLVRNLPRRAG